MQQMDMGSEYNVLVYKHLPCEVVPTGGTSTNGTLTINVSTPTFSGDTITIAASASDTNPTNSVTAIQVYIDGVMKFSSANSSQITPINQSFTITPGTHTIAIKAFNSAGTNTLVTTTAASGANCNAFSNLLDDVWFYIPSTDTEIQALEFDPDFFDVNFQYLMSMQCDRATGFWHFWDANYYPNAVSPQPHGKWLDATDKPISLPNSYPCNLTNETDTWHHYQLYGTVNTSNQTYTFHTLIVDGSAIYQNLSVTLPAQPQSPGARVLNVQQQIDNAYSSQAQTNMIYYDSYNLTIW